MKQLLVATSLLCGCMAGFSAGTSAPGSGPPPAVAYEPPPPEARHAGAMPSRMPPGQWTLEEKQYWIKLHEELDAYAAQANEHCGSHITATFVHESFRGRMTADQHFGLDLDTRATCGAMAHSLIEVCNGGSTARQAVAAQIHQLVCEYGPARYGINDGVFHASINTEPTTLDTNYNTMLAVIRRSL